jgi:hypothetical protein
MTFVQYFPNMEQNAATMQKDYYVGGGMLQWSDGRE